MFKVLLIASIAALGGLAVFVGLWWEVYGEKEEYENISDFRRSKEKARKGMKWVLWGVFAEMVLGFGVAVYEGSEMITAESRLAPENQPIRSISAIARFSTRSGDKWPLPGTEPSGFPFVSMIRGTNLSNSLFGLTSSGTTSDWQLSTVLGEKPYLDHIVQFHQSLGTNFGRDFAIGKPARIINDVTAFAIWLDPMPTNTELLFGTVEVTINSSLQWTFDIPPQKSSSGFLTGMLVTNKDGKVHSEIWPMTYASWWDRTNVHRYDGK